VTSVAQRVEATAATLQQTILQPARDGLALRTALNGIFAGFREPRETPGPWERPAPREPRESHDDLFIG
jgi:hypothetical protein